MPDETTQQFFRQLRFLVEFKVIQLATDTEPSPLPVSHWALLNDELHAGTGALLERTEVFCFMQPCGPTMPTNLIIERRPYVQTTDESMFSTDICTGSFMFCIPRC